MNYFIDTIYGVIMLLFPITVCILYQAYNKIYNFKYNDLCNDFAFFSSFYLVTKLPYDFKYLLISIPLFLAYFQKRDLSAILLSLLSIGLIYYRYDVSIIIVIVELIIYFIIYKIFRKKSIYLFPIIKMLFYLIYVHELINQIIILFIYIMTFYITYIFFKKATELLEYKEEVKKMEEDKEVRLSLFKITHEIKNPITVCKGYLDMFDLNDVDKSNRYINIINEEIDHVLLLLEDFLSINKIKIKKDIMDINLLLEEVSNNFIPLLKDKKIKRNIIISKDELFINGDYNRLSQVLINVIKNSIESITDNGVISIYLKEYENYIEIHVEDNGIGMDEYELEQLKKPFFTTKQKGTGLGVYLSKQIIKAHNGSITYETKKYEGTKTIIKIPKS